MRRLAITPKLMASLAVLGAAASIAGLGTFATFTSSTTAQNQALTTGTVSITLGSANRLAVGASNLVPELQSRGGWGTPFSFLAGCGAYFATRALV